ncbi:DUF5688 family protein [Brotaphodocola sp.]|uniref:DUF5688 family protein n=1 Tax=Brotaphodocola sp. TaxID=3073577 RepID=UPI003D7E925B
MDYKEFLETVTQNLHHALGESCRIDVCPLQKNNGVTLDGIRLYQNGQLFVPTIYLNAYFDAYKNHAMSIEEILADILGLYENAMPPSRLSPEFMSDFDSLKSRVMYRLIHTESNQELLKEVPSIRFLDLSVVFFLYIEENAVGQLTTPIRKEHLRQWKIGVSDLWKLARVNTPTAYPPVIQNMSDALEDLSNLTGIEPIHAPSPYLHNLHADSMDTIASNELTGTMIGEQDETECETTTPPIYILTNSSGLYGAGCMLYPTVLEDLSDRLNQDLLILPSSIHEVLVLPADTPIGLRELQVMITTINQTEVLPEDRLSNQIYFYRREDGMIDILPEEIFVTAPTS